MPSPQSPVSKAMPQNLTARSSQKWSRTTTRHFCALLPLCKHPKQDLATPAKVTRRASARLRKRAQYERNKNEKVARTGLQQLLKGFPWNAGTRAAAAKRNLPPCRLQWRLGDNKCLVCDASNGRACSCGANFAAATVKHALTSYLNFVRRSTTPVYEEDSPEDQWQLGMLMADIFANAKSVSHKDAWEAFARFAVLASFSGNPETVESLKIWLVPAATHPVFLSALDNHLDANKRFWRGGQAHGKLCTAEISAAFAEFFKKHSSTLAASLQTWNSAHTIAERGKAVRDVYWSLKACSVAFKAADYFIKRTLEICVLAGTHKILGFQIAASDLDLLSDVWPIGTGTRTGLQIIWPGALRTPRHEREGLRVLQRALGGGRRKVPLLRISALLCFWHQALNGRLPWQVSALQSTV